MTDTTAHLAKIEAEASKIRAQLDEAARRREAARVARERAYDEQLVADYDNTAAVERLDARSRQARQALVDALQQEPWFAALVDTIACRHLAADRQSRIAGAMSRLHGAAEADRVWQPAVREISPLGLIIEAVEAAVRDLVVDAAEEADEHRRRAVEDES